MIFYFSATGNSKYLAQKLADITGDMLYDIAAELRGDCGYTLREGEVVYIVSPVYFYGMPLNVKDFIDRMTFNIRPLIDVTINFGTFPGAAMDSFEKEIVSKGFEVRNRYAIRMPENYVPLFEPPAPERVDEILDEADRTMERISGIIASGRREDVGVQHSLPKDLFGYMARPMYVYGRRTRKFHTTNSCTGCGLCADICPDGVIAMRDDRPSWDEKRCLRCCSCINRCPRGAIEFGRLTKGRRRYHNPRI